MDKRLQVDEIPLNFLVPIKGTPLEKRPPEKPVEILKTIAMVRLTNPAAGIRLAAGRTHLGYLQSMIFHAGCSSMMIGKMLTVAGGKVYGRWPGLTDLVRWAGVAFLVYLAIRLAADDGRLAAGPD